MQTPQRTARGLMRPLVTNSARPLERGLHIPMSSPHGPRLFPTNATPNSSRSMLQIAAAGSHEGGVQFGSLRDWRAFLFCIRISSSTRVFEASRNVSLPMAIEAHSIALILDLLYSVPSAFRNRFNTLEWLLGVRNLASICNHHQRWADKGRN